MEYYSDNITKSLKIFFLLKNDIHDSITLLEENQPHSVQRLAFKSLYIDLCSFVDELNAFVSILYSEPFDDYKSVNNFLILSHQSKKLLNKNDKFISKLRNTIFAHNYRDKSNDFVDPLASLIPNHDDAPVLASELKFLGKVAILIGSLAVQCFNFNSEIALAYFRKSSEQFGQLFPIIEKKKTTLERLSIKQLKKEIYLLQDTLKSHEDNYNIVSKKIKCKIRI